jgi:predicted phage terminase large subunit-like protein
MTSQAEAAAELLARRRARTHMINFVQYTMDEYHVSDFAVQVCEALDQFYDDMTAGKRPILILQAPPQHGKSELVSRRLPAYLLGRNPDLSIGALSYGKDLATDMNRDVQRIMMDEPYMRIFPESTLNPRRVVTIDVEAKRNSEMFEVSGHKGRYIAQGVGGPLTGKRLDVGIIDDPIKNAKEALSATVKDAVWNWYISTFLTRLSKNSGQIIMATRWATDDLSGRILESNKNARLLSFPAISEEGQALVPELHPVEKLLETKSTMSSHFWSAMYQQQPVIQGGGIFKAEWWRYYRALPDLEYRMIYADTAMKTGEKNDYSVFQCWGKGKDGKIYLLDMIRGKWEAPELKARAKAFWLKHKGQCNGTLRKMKVEDKSSGTGLIQQLKQEGIPVEGIPRNTDKTVRGYDAAPMIEAGNVYLSENIADIDAMLDEAAAFPNGPHDDTLDPMMDAVSDMLVSSSGLDYSRLTAM